VVLTFESSTISPSGLVKIRSLNPEPGPVVTEVTMLAPINRSEALVVVTAPEELVLPLPKAPLATSKGIDGSRTAIFKGPNIRIGSGSAELHGHGIRAANDVFRIVD
jgi:hypothetical protein